MESSILIFIITFCICYLGISAQNTEIGGDCTRTTDCFGGSDVTCKDGVCTCSGNSVPTEDNKRCIPSAEHNQPCLFNRQCNYSDKAECMKGRCQCMNGYNYNGTLCIGNLLLGDPCTEDIDCTVLYDPNQKTVWCYSKQCNCRPGYAREGDNRCVVGGDCIKDEDCVYLENSHCNTLMRDRAKCACNKSFVAALNSTKCYPAAKKVGEGCEDKSQCTENLGKSVCVNKHCECEKGVYPNKDNTKCGAPVSTIVSISCLALLIFVKLL